MSDATLFAIFFVGLFVVRIIVATVVFYYIIPQGDRCPNCDAVTVRVQHTVWNRLFPWLRTSWCYECGWEGTLRHGSLSPAPSGAPREKERSPAP